MANSYLMRPGSSTIEITPYEFGKMKGVFGPCTQNAQVCMVAARRYRRPAGWPAGSSSLAHLLSCPTVHALLPCPS